MDAAPLLTPRTAPAPAGPDEGTAAEQAVRRDLAAAYRLVALFGMDADGDGEADLGPALRLVGIVGFLIGAWSPRQLINSFRRG